MSSCALKPTLFLVPQSPVAVSYANGVEDGAKRWEHRASGLFAGGVHCGYKFVVSLVSKESVGAWCADSIEQSVVVFAETFFSDCVFPSEALVVGAGVVRLCASCDELSVQDVAVGSVYGKRLASNCAIVLVLELVCRARIASVVC